LIERTAWQGYSSQFENNNFAEMCNSSEAGSYLRLTDSVYHSTVGLRAVKKKKKMKKEKADTTMPTETWNPHPDTSII